MAKYKIHRWDPVVYGNNQHPFPTIYIKPDKEFLDFVEQNKNAVIVKIDSTNTIYDGKAMVGIVSSTSDKPTCMPNYYNATGLYTISLYARWYEYPQLNSLGTATITGLKGKYKAPPVNVPPYKPPVPVEEPYKDDNSCNDNRMNGTQIATLLIGILIVFGVLLWISYSTKKS